ncbi:MAG: hypothetical protein HOK52_14795 [Candidatus Marinimicrobia bacterium]|jgi:hypothetical protein|nr:hypothetical protein [Candidatus Neomarinimicrobiota bacterium]
MKPQFEMLKKILSERVQKVDELSTELLGRYKTKAGADASAADKKGDFKQGNKRFSGIVKATKKQFKNNEEVDDDAQKEELKVSDGLDVWIKAFQGSDAPQFDEKDDEEIRNMAIAAFLAAKKKLK